MAVLLDREIRERKREGDRGERIHPVKYTQTALFFIPRDEKFTHSFNTYTF